VLAGPWLFLDASVRLGWHGLRFRGGAGLNGQIKMILKQFAILDSNGLLKKKVFFKKELFLIFNGNVSFNKAGNFITPFHHPHA
jgi:hypothetical protein